MPRYTEAEARAAVGASRSYAEALRRLKLVAKGGNHKLFRKWVDEIWQIPTDHFDPFAASIEHFRRPAPPLEEVLVESSTYRRATLKRRLLEEGLKQAVCELCGQGEIWRGNRMALILDHINGVPDDNRLENLRIVCPNCAATLETHCGRKNGSPPTYRDCARCGKTFLVKYRTHRYCSRECGTRVSNNQRGIPQPHRRKVTRPPYEQLLSEIQESNFLALGRKYGVSDNAIRKWIVWYERERERASTDGHDGSAAASKAA